MDERAPCPRKTNTEEQKSSQSHLRISCSSRRSRTRSNSQGDSAEQPGGRSFAGEVLEAFVAEEGHPTPRQLEKPKERGGVATSFQCANLVLNGRSVANGRPRIQPGTTDVPLISAQAQAQPANASAKLPMPVRFFDARRADPSGLTILEHANFTSGDISRVTPLAQKGGVIAQGTAAADGTRSPESIRRAPPDLGGGGYR